MKRRGLRTPLRRIDVLCAAKVNLGLAVGDARPDGYHEVEGLIQTISLVDRVELQVHDDPDEVTGEVVSDDLGLTVTGAEGDPSLATEDNLALVAARAVSRRVAPRPTSIVCHKRIPVAAGLGGGSADAAGVLMGLALIWGADLTAADLVRMGAGVGSDVPAILTGGLVHVSGRGERIRRVGSAGGMAVVLGVSEDGLATADVYRRLDELRAARRSPSRTPFANDLEPAAVDLAPAVAEGLDAMRRAGAPVTFVSGSGPTVVGVVPDPAEADGIARRARDAFARTIVCRPQGWGVRMRLGGAGGPGRSGAGAE